MLVQKLRLQRGWSQQQLAEFAGLSPRTIQRLENGQAASPDTLKSLAAVFEVDFNLLRNTAEQATSAPTEEPLAMNPDTPVLSANTLGSVPSPTAPSAQRRAQLEREEREALQHVGRLRKLYGHAARFAVVIPVLTLINALQPHAPWWVLWVIVGWGLGLAFHAARVLGREHFFGPQWEKRHVERRLGRSLDDTPPP